MCFQNLLAVWILPAMNNLLVKSNILVYCFHYLQYLQYFQYLQYLQIIHFLSYALISTIIFCRYYSFEMQSFNQNNLFQMISIK